MNQPCPDCKGRIDTRNQKFWFCVDCAAVINTVTGEMTNAYGQHVRNVIADHLDQRAQND